MTAQRTRAVASSTPWACRCPRVISAPDSVVGIAIARAPPPSAAAVAFATSITRPPPSATTRPSPPAPRAHASAAFASAGTVPAGTWCTPAAASATGASCAAARGVVSRRKPGPPRTATASAATPRLNRMVRSPSRQLKSCAVTGFMIAASREALNADALRGYPSPLPVDDTDRQIVALLRQDARRSFQSIGARVSLSAPAVKRRVDRLEAEGVLRGYTALVEPGRFGWDTHAVVFLYCEGRMAAAEVREALEPHPEVEAAYTVAGEASAVVHVRARDTSHLEEALERIRAHRGVTRTQTQIVLSTLFERPFDEGAGASGR